LNLAELAFLADQALTEALVAAQVDASDPCLEDPNLLSILNDHGFAVIVRPMYPGNGTHNITLRHIGGAELDAAGPDVGQLLWGFLGVEAIFEDASTQPSDSETT
jgi:hypothetical protein